MSKRLFARATLTCASLCCSASLRASDGAIPIYQATTITASGSYVVTRDLSVGGAAIQIQAPHVDLDLGGHLVTSTGGVAISITEASSITIRNGVLDGGTDGVVVSLGSVAGDAVTSVVLERLRVQSVGDRGLEVTTQRPTRVEVHDVHIVNATGYGIYVAGGRGCSVRVRETTIQKTQRGIYTYGVPTVDIAGCTIRSTTEQGIDVTGPQDDPPGVASIVGNILEDIGTDGIEVGWVAGGAITGNRIVHIGVGTSPNPILGISLARGVSTTSGVLVSTNIVRCGSTSVDGIAVAISGRDNTIRDNVVSDCRSGIQSFAPGVRIVSNESLGNSQYGVYVSAARCVVESNQVRGNSCGLYLTGATASVPYRDNVLNGNTSAVCGSGGSDKGGNIF